MVKAVGFLAILATGALVLGLEPLAYSTNLAEAFITMLGQLFAWAFGTAFLVISQEMFFPGTLYEGSAGITKHMHQNKGWRIALGLLAWVVAIEVLYIAVAHHGPVHMFLVFVGTFVLTVIALPTSENKTNQRQSVTTE